MPRRWIHRACHRIKNQTSERSAVQRRSTPRTHRRNPMLPPANSATSDPTINIRAKRRPVPISLQTLDRLFSANMVTKLAVVIMQHEFLPERQIFPSNNAKDASHDSPWRATSELTTIRPMNFPVDQPINHHIPLHFRNDATRVCMSEHVGSSSDQCDKFRATFLIRNISS